MNQTGHEFPNMVGIDPQGLDEKISSLLPGYMTMGQTGMDMGRMVEVMPVPRNSIPMKRAVGPLGEHICMGEMFTILKVRDRLKSCDQDPNWYPYPPGSVAMKTEEAELRRDGIV